MSSACTAAFQLLAVLMCIALAAGQCTFNDGEYEYDFTPLIRQLGQSDYQWVHPASLDEYLVNICADSHSRCIAGTGMCVKVTGGPYISCGESSDTNFRELAGAKAGQGATLVYGNGASCGSQPRSTFVNLACDKDVDGAILDRVSESSSCRFDAHFRTKYGCGKKLGSSSGGGMLISWGWIIIICFFSLALLYLVIGAAVKWKWMDAEGVDIIPNVEFWKALPLLVWEGMAYSWRLTAGCCSCTYEKIQECRQ